MKKIDLGMSYEEMESEMPKMRDEHYPSFTYDGPESLDLPHEGTMTVKFKKIRSSESENHGKKHYSCTIEVEKILDVEAEEDEAPTRKYNEAEKSLDDLMEKKMRKGY